MFVDYFDNCYTKSYNLACEKITFFNFLHCPLSPTFFRMVNEMREKNTHTIAYLFYIQITLLTNHAIIDILTVRVITLYRTGAWLVRPL